MSGPKPVSKEEYEEFRSNMEEKYGYDSMSDEEKADFDSKIDKVAVIEDKTDNNDDDDDEQVEKGEFDDGHPQSIDDDEQVL